MVNLQTLDVQHLKTRGGEATTLEHLPDDHQLQKLTLRVPSPHHAPDLLEQAPLLTNLITSPHMRTITITTMQIDYSSGNPYQMGGLSAADYDWDLRCQLRKLIRALNTTSSFTKLVINNLQRDDPITFRPTKYLKQVCTHPQPPPSPVHLK
jgi:hypothetical protein